MILKPEEMDLIKQNILFNLQLWHVQYHFNQSLLLLHHTTPLLFNNCRASFVQKLHFPLNIIRPAIMFPTKNTFAPAG